MPSYLTHYTIREALKRAREMRGQFNLDGFTYMNIPAIREAVKRGREENSLRDKLDELTAEQ